MLRKLLVIILLLSAIQAFGHQPFQILEDSTQLIKNVSN